VNDRVDRALRVLRERESGASSHAEETLQRVLAERQAAKRARARRAQMWLPIAAVLAFSTAALARWGSGGTVRALFVPRYEAAQTRDDLVPAPRSSVVSPSPSETDAGGLVASEKMPLPVSSSAPAATTPVPVATVPRAAMPTKRVVPAVAASVAAAGSASTSDPAEEPPSRATAAGASSESDAYEHAHRLHFGGGDPAAALHALDDYLLRFPDGRFAPDGRYNRAIDLVKLHRYVEARAALRPFAEGSFGGYHRDEARALLRSIPQR
jgi:hypothetical protein